MNIEVKNSAKAVDYLESMKFLEKRVQDVFFEKGKELLWILEHNSVYTAGTNAKLIDVIDKNLKVIKCPAFENKEVVDKVGAGDTMLSIVAPLFYLKNNPNFIYAVICIYYATGCVCILYACRVDVKLCSSSRHFIVNLS